MDKIYLNGPLVNAEWLNKNLKATNLHIIDATLPKVGTSDGKQSLHEHQIVNARFLDIKNVFSETDAAIPNTMLSESKFNLAARKLGINHDAAIVVYDVYGIYSSARVWWMFKAMGHANVAVLDGGLKAWEELSFPIELKNEKDITEGDFKGKLDPEYFRDHKQVLERLSESENQIIDARAEERFKGLVDEPRIGLRSGHIPGSVNLPYTELLENGRMKSEVTLKSVFGKIANNQEQLIFSCGSGITACVLALGAELAGYSGNTVYDGSWTEWGSLKELPVER